MGHVTYYDMKVHSVSTLNVGTEVKENPLHYLILENKIWCIFVLNCEENIENTMLVLELLLPMVISRRRSES